MKRATSARSVAEPGACLLDRQRLERCTGAVRRAGHGRFAHLEHLGHLGGAEAERVAQDADRALVRRQALERGDERQADRLRRGLRSCARVGHRTAKLLGVVDQLAADDDAVLDLEQLVVLDRRGRRTMRFADPGELEAVIRANVDTLRRSSIECGASVSCGCR